MPKVSSNTIAGEAPNPLKDPYADFLDRQNEILRGQPERSIPPSSSFPPPIRTNLPRQGIAS